MMVVLVMMVMVVVVGIDDDGSVSDSGGGMSCRPVRSTCASSSLARPLDCTSFKALCASRIMP